MSYDLVLRSTRRSWSRGLLSTATGSSVGRATREQRRARRLLRIQQLKSRAAAGDPRAVARLQQMRAALGLPANAASPPPFKPLSPPAYLPTAYQPTYAPPSYQPSYAQPPAYASPYYDESLSQDPYGPPPQPTVDVFQGEEEAELARDGGSTERAALSRSGRA
jgi:hypothetical protein